MQLSRSLAVVFGWLAVFASISNWNLACGELFRESGDFKGIKTLKEAVKLAQKQLADSGRPEYAALLSEERVRTAVRTAVKSYEITAMTKSEKRFPGTKDHFEKAIKPICLRVADKGEWPSGCSIGAYFSLVDERNGEKIAYDGLGLGLQIETPDATLEGFALPILTLFFGKVEAPCE